MVRSVLFVAVAIAWIGCSKDLVGPPPGGGGGGSVVSGSIAVRVTSSGQALDPDGYTLLIDGQVGAGVGANGTVTIDDVDIGSHEVQLADLAANCVVGTANPRNVSVVAGGIATADFQVTCHPIFVSAVFSGQGQAAGVGIAVEEPLVVRVTDNLGTPVQAVEVYWIVDEARGALDGFDGDGAPLATVVTTTDADGLARASLVPTWFGRIGVLAYAPACDDYCPGGSPVRFWADASDPDASLSSASATYRRSEAGQSSEPMVVSVRDGDGRAVAHAAVDWVISFGVGTLEFGRSWTDANGLAHTTVVPQWFGRVSVDARVAGVRNSPVIFATDATDLDATLTLASGDGQAGKAGEQLPEPLVVRVTDGGGDPVDLIQVEWSVEEGNGDLLERLEPTGDGLDAVDFSPRTLGNSRVVARLPGLAAHVAFTTEATVLVIRLLESNGYGMFWGVGGVDCDGWGYSCTAYDPVPVGTPVEWVTEASTARIVSTSVPSGGASFDSGTLHEGERFLFVPDVAGTWGYEDTVSGATGILSVY